MGRIYVSEKQVCLSYVRVCAKKNKNVKQRKNSHKNHLYNVYHMITTLPASRPASIIVTMILLLFAVCHHTAVAPGKCTADIIVVVDSALWKKTNLVFFYDSAALVGGVRVVPFYFLPHISTAAALLYDSMTKIIAYVYRMM